MAKEFKILTERYSYTARTTLGRMSFVYDMYVSDPPTPHKEFFGNTLEDTLRAPNIKVTKETGLPGGLRCKVRIYDSPTKGKVPLFYTEDDGITIKSGLLSWTYCEAHGGNDHKDTDACVLVAKNILSADSIQGSLKDKLVEVIEKKISEGYEIVAEFINLPQLS